MNMRMERIERLLKELEYEMTRGMLEREIEESVGFSFVVPTSKEGNGWAVYCQFRTRPMPIHNIRITGVNGLKARLEVIDGGKA